jgi:hypothetical protein
MQPSEKGLDVEEKDEGGEGVALDCASADENRLGSETRGFVEDDGGRCMQVDTLDGGNSVWWEAKVSEDAVKFFMADGIESAGEVHV